MMAYGSSILPSESCKRVGFRSLLNGSGLPGPTASHVPQRLGIIGFLGQFETPDRSPQQRTSRVTTLQLAYQHAAATTGLAVQSTLSAILTKLKMRCLTLGFFCFPHIISISNRP